MVVTLEEPIGTPAGPSGVPLGGTDQDTADVLDRIARRLEDIDAPPSAAAGIRALFRQVGQPCVVAIVGQVNSGKSTFINGLLRADKAVIGSTETTATISHFVYGEPDPDRPVRCHWRDGRITEETDAFLASLQGRDLDALRRAEGIDRLEYLIPSPVLRTVTIVDTPGTGAVVGEHEARTADFLDLSSRLRERHTAETVRIHDAADAIVYLVGAVARTSDHDLLNQFADLSGAKTRAMNALGVIAKVDLSAELLERRFDLADKIARQLESQLNEVVPVSAGLARAIDRLTEGDLERFTALVDTVRRIPAAQLDLLLQNEELFCDYDPDGSPVPAAERRAIRQLAPCEWRVFAAIVEEARVESPPAEIIDRLTELAGFGRLRKVLQDHFLERAAVLRCYRIVLDARALLQRLRYSTVLPERRRAEVERARLERFIEHVDAARGGRAETAIELRAYLCSQIATVEGKAQVEQVWRDVELDLGRLLRRLEDHNADFVAVQAMEASSAVFSKEEIEELRALFGVLGTDTSRRLRGSQDPTYCIERQLAWRMARERAGRGSSRWLVADRAHARLGLLLDELDCAAEAAAADQESVAR